MYISEILSRFRYSLTAPVHTPTPTPDHSETNDQQMRNEVICASVTLVSTLSCVFLLYRGWGCSQGVSQSQSQE